MATYMISATQNKTSGRHHSITGFRPMSPDGAKDYFQRAENLMSDVFIELPKTSDLHSGMLQKFFKPLYALLTSKNDWRGTLRGHFEKFFGMSASLSDATWFFKTTRMHSAGAFTAYADDTLHAENCAL